MYITDFGLTTYQTISALFIHEAKALNQVCIGRQLGALAAGRRVPGFLKLILCGSLVCVFVCVFVCVSAPKAISNL